MSDSKNLFCSLCRRLHRLQKERKEARAARNAAMANRLARRCAALTEAIFNLELS